MPWTRVSWTGRGVTTARPAPPCGGRPGWGPGPRRPIAPHPNPPPQAGEGAGVAGGPRADGRAPLPPLAGEGPDGGRLRGDPLPPTPTLPRNRGVPHQLAPCRRRHRGPPPHPPTLPRKRGVPQQLVPCRRRTSVLRPRPASPCTPGHGRPGATDVQRAPLRRRRLRLTPPVPVPAHAPAPSRRPRPPAHRTTP